MKAKQTIITTGVVVGGLAVMGGLFVPEIYYRGASALEYQDSVDVQFNYEATLSMTLSSGTVSIADLAPGNSASSATPLTITTATNNISGYTLSASVGDGSTYTTTSLVNGGAELASVGYTANGVADVPTTGSGVWAYKVGSNNYNGFASVSTAVTLRETSTPSASDAVTFNIKAYAPTGQVAGEYTNVINFTSVTNPITND